MSPKVSVLIPVYNREKEVSRALESVMSQSLGDFEIIVIDNKSTDATWTTLQSWESKDSRVKIFQNSENLGPLKNWINGLAQCKGEYIKVLWSDDALERDCLESCCKVLDTNPDAGLVFTSTLIHLFDKDIAAYHYPDCRKFETPEYICNTIMGENLPVSPGCVMLRKKDAQFCCFPDGKRELQNIANRFGAGPDVNFILQAAIRYPYVAHIPQFLCRFYGDADSFTLQNKKEVSKGYSLTFEHLLEKDLKFSPIQNLLRSKKRRLKWRSFFKRLNLLTKV